MRLHFSDGGTILDAEGRAMVDELVATLGSRTDITRVRVEGHAEDQGSHAETQRVARQRAEAVVDHMVNDLGMPRELFEVVSYGDERPITSETTATDRVQNRRVEFSILVRRQAAP